MGRHYSQQLTINGGNILRSSLKEAKKSKRLSNTFVVVLWNQIGR